MTDFINDPKEVKKLVSKEPLKYIEFAGIYRTQEFLDTMLHRVPDTSPINRKESILYFCKGKKVLHLGCRGHSKKPNPLHNELNTVCSELWGLDIEPCDIPNFIQADLNKSGWEKHFTDQTFDVLLATEIIEHLSNAGIFLDACHSFDSKLFLTTPNAYDHNRYNIMQLGIEYNNYQHVAYYSYTTLKTLVERHQYEVVEFYWTDYPVQFFSRGLTFILNPV